MQDIGIDGLSPTNLEGRAQGRAHIRPKAAPAPEGHHTKASMSWACVVDVSTSLQQQEEGQLVDSAKTSLVRSALFPGQGTGQEKSRMDSDPVTREDERDFRFTGRTQMPKGSQPQLGCSAQAKRVRNGAAIAWKKTSMRWQQRTVPGAAALRSRFPQAPGITGMFTTEHQGQATEAARASLATGLVGNTPDVPIRCCPG